MPDYNNGGQCFLDMKQDMKLLEQHTHCCLLYESEQEQLEAVSAFILSGIEQGHKCIYIVNDGDISQIRDFIYSAGVDMEKLLASGALSILDESNTYTKEDTFDPDYMIRFLIKEAKAAKEQGYVSLRVTGDAGWALYGKGDLERLMEYEVRLNKLFFPKYPCIALCRYDIRKFDPKVIKYVIYTHHVLIRKGRVYRNFYHIEPDTYTDDYMKLDHEVRYLLDNLEKERQFQESLRESEGGYRRLFETMTQGVVYMDREGMIISANPAAQQILGFNLAQMQNKGYMLKYWQMTDDEGRIMQYNEYPSMIALKTGKKTGPEIRGIYNLKDNTHIWLNITAIPLFLPDGNKPYQTYIIFEDITKQKELEESLKRSELFMKTIMDHLPIGVAVNTVFPHAKPDYINDNFVRLYRTDKDKVIEPDSFWEEVYEDEKFREDLKKRVMDDCASVDPKRMVWENVPITRKGEETTYITAMNIPVPDSSLMISTVMDVTRQNLQDRELKHIEWMLNAEKVKQSIKNISELESPYGDLTVLNRSRSIMDAVGKELLLDIVQDYLGLLESSTAVYEKNGDYALGLFCSGWCKLLDSASRKLCQGDDNQEALDSGCWLCHESCWTKCAKIAIDTGKPADVPCQGGLHIYTVPIYANNEVIGAINFGYGSPPTDDSTLMSISKKYKVSVSELKSTANAYQKRPPFIIELAKERLKSSAKLIGTIVEYKMMERDRENTLSRFEALMENSPSLIMLFDEKGRYLEASASAAGIFGLTRDEMQKKDFSQLLSPDTVNNFMETLTMIKREEKATGKTDLLKLGDEQRIYESIIFPIKSRDDEIDLFGSIAVDVTERKQAEIVLQQHLNEMTIILKISSALRTADRLDAILSILLNETLGLFDANDGAVCLYSPENRKLYLLAARGWLKQMDDAFYRSWEDIPDKIPVSDGVYVLEEYIEDPDIDNIKNAPKGWKGAFIPIFADREIVGILNVSIPRERAVNKEELSLLKALSEMTGSALHRLNLYEETNKRLNQLQRLRTIDRAITGSLDLRLTLNIVLEQVVTQLGVDAACVFLLQPRLKTLEYSAGRGFKTKILENASLKMGETCAGKAAFENRIFMCEQNEAHDDKCRRILESEGFTSNVAIPLTAKGEVIGVLEVFSVDRKRYDPDWIDFLETLAGQAAIAIDNARLFEDIKKSNLDLTLAYDATIEGWAKALELRDGETEGHSRRVAEMTIKLARGIGIAEERLADVYRGALLHHIGKMGISDNILLKPGKLIDEEWVIMKQHPKLAYDMLASVDYLRSAREIPYCHHEKWDGSGYPRRLKMESIPLEARVFAVIDVFDALTSDRPYRKAWTKEKALEYIRQESGRHFDPKVVMIFLDVQTGVL